MTKINLELLIDLDMQLVVEEQIRRRIWNLVLRYVKAKNILDDITDVDGLFL